MHHIKVQPLGSKETKDFNQTVMKPKNKNLEKEHQRCSLQHCIAIKLISFRFKILFQEPKLIYDKGNIKSFELGTQSQNKKQLSTNRYIKNIHEYKKAKAKKSQGIDELH